MKIVYTILLVLFVHILATGQSLEKGNEHYRLGEYASAIPIFEAVIKEKPKNMTVKSKLANCYRILNQPRKAEPIFAELIDDQSSKPIDFLHYGEVLMQNSKYDLAKKILKEYTILNPEDAKGKLLFEACDKVKTLKPMFDNLVIVPFDHNTEGDENSPVFYRGDLIFASDRYAGFQVLKTKNEATGRDYIHIWQSKKSGTGGYDAPKELEKFSELNKNTGNASFTADGKEVFFARNSVDESRSNSFNMQIYTAHSKDGVRWKGETKLSFCSKESNYMHPAISPDGKRLFFITNKTGEGGMDIFVSKRTKKGWSNPENLGNKVNTPAHEGFPTVGKDNKLYFCSKGHPGYGGFDIFYTKENENGEWQTPVNVGMPINSPYDDISLCFSDSLGAFTSSRNGKGDDIFLFSLNADANERNSNLVLQKKVELSKDETVSAVSRNAKYELQKNAKSADSLDTSRTTGYTIEPERIAKSKVEKTKPKDAKSSATLDSEEADTKKVRGQKDSLETSLKATFITKLSSKLETKKLKPNQKFIIENFTVPAKGKTIELNVQQKETLEQLAEIMKSNKKLNIEIIAHTECDADLAESKKRSESLAILMQAYLVENGVKLSRITPKGSGSMRPIKDCKEETCTPAEVKANNRVEIKFLGK
jgi:outer membrane protein OmpA-like peptidoglycan-associated protein